ncbi:MAG: serine acetyltransferase [Acidobacteriota bacterium]
MSKQKTGPAIINDRLKQATLNIVDSYNSPKMVTQHLNRGCLPARDAIISLLTAVQELVFPGYFGISGLDETNISARTHSLVYSLFDDLATQIRLCLFIENRLQPQPPCEKLQQEAESRALLFLEAIPQLRQALSLDVQAAYDGDPAARSYDEIILAYPGVYAIMVYRIAHCLAELDVPLIPRIMTEQAHSLTGIDIHPRAIIGDSFFIDHGTGVVIGETTVIGNHVKLYQGVTLGALSIPKNAHGELIRSIKRHPTIEDDVVIYAGATILGGDTVVGEGSIIGGNVWLTHSVPPHTKLTARHY